MAPRYLQVPTWIRYANPPRKKYRLVDHRNRSGHPDRCTKHRRLGQRICLYLRSRR